MDLFEINLVSKRGDYRLEYQITKNFYRDATFAKNTKLGQKQKIEKLR